MEPYRNFLAHPSVVAHLENMTTLKSLPKNPHNPRTITDQKRDQLANSLKEFGPLDGFVFNEKTGHLVTGHQRQDIFTDGEVKITKTYGERTKTGTVSVGHVVYRGDRYSVRNVFWPLQKEKAAMLAANRNGGAWDEGKLKEVLEDLSAGGYNLDLTMFDESERETFLADPEFDEDEGKSPTGKKTVCPHCNEEFTVGGRK